MMMMRHSVVPWILTVFMAVFVLVLQWRTERRTPPQITYGFYDTTTVNILVGSNENQHDGFLDIYGTYNNVVEGQRQIVKAQAISDGMLQLLFEVNSPRPAMLYLNEKALQVFLVPDSTLTLEVKTNPLSYQIDSVFFHGYSSEISYYYQEKSNRFGEITRRSNRNTVYADNPIIFSSLLDSMADEELVLLNEYQALHALPEWFVNFEQNEILYHKAYLKRSNHEPEKFQLYPDKVPVNNEGAVFSYYYYLYLKSYIAQTYPGSAGRSEEATLRQMAVADTLLSGEIHDVFFTRTVFDYLRRDQLTFAETLMDKYGDNFNSKKYQRYLHARIKDRLDLSLQEARMEKTRN